MCFSKTLSSFAQIFYQHNHKFGMVKIRKNICKVHPKIFFPSLRQQFTVTQHMKLLHDMINSNQTLVVPIDATVFPN